MREFKWSGALLCALALAACGDDSRPPITGDAGPITRDGGRDAGGPPDDDGGTDPDAGGDMDAGGLCDDVDCSGMDDMCNLGVCDPATGTCGTEPRADGTACDDADACTTTDVCTAGTCGGADVDCSGMTNMCNVGMCDPTSGACVAMARMDGTACDDGALCTTGDACRAGTCGGTMVDCSGSSDMCNAGSCDPATGACTRTPVMDGTTCDDTDVCTTPDVCTAGSCGGTRVSVSDTCACAAIVPEMVGTQTFTGATSGLVGDFDGGCGLSGASPDTVYTLTLTASRLVRVETITAGTDYDTVVHVRRTCSDDTSVVACNDDKGDGTLQSRVLTVLDPGTYSIVIDGYDGNSGSYTFEVQLADVPGSCLQWQRAGATANGTYMIQPPGAAAPVSVLCDMTTDGGGWTLVQSTRTAGPLDQATTYHANLTTLSPMAGVAGAQGVWDGLRTVVADRGDIRFACRGTPGPGAMTVDLSFYDTDWYRDITTGTDAMSCFQEADGTGMDRPQPSRRNNLTGAVLHLGNARNHTVFCTAAGGPGCMEGEDSCGDTGDFTVDFDDRAMDSNQSDGTDWGLDDSARKCGMSGLTDGEWFIWVRETSRPHGHAFLIGHDYFARETNADLILGNAVFHANQRGPVNVLVYNEFSDNSPTGEVANSRAAIDARATALGRTVTYTDLTSSAMLEASLATADVLLLPEQELSAPATLDPIGTTWTPILNAFIARGGTVVACEYQDNTRRLVRGAGLFTAATHTDITSLAVTIPAPVDTVAEGAVGYTAPDGSNSYPGSSGGTVAVQSGTDPVVRHIVR